MDLNSLVILSAYWILRSNIAEGGVSVDFDMLQHAFCSFPLAERFNTLASVL
jgi:hypothetical protein